jgi:hypothetical protein
MADRAPPARHLNFRRVMTGTGSTQTTAVARSSSRADRFRRDMAPARPQRSCERDDQIEFGIRIQSVEALRASPATGAALSVGSHPLHQWPPTSRRSLAAKMVEPPLEGRCACRWQRFWGEIRQDMSWSISINCAPWNQCEPSRRRLNGSTSASRRFCPTASNREIEFHAGGDRAQDLKHRNRPFDVRNRALWLALVQVAMTAAGHSHRGLTAPRFQRRRQPAAAATNQRLGTCGRQKPAAAGAHRSVVIPASPQEENMRQTNQRRQRPC